MIERVVIKKNYKCIKNANIAFNKFKNISVVPHTGQTFSSCDH